MADPKRCASCDEHPASGYCSFCQPPTPQMIALVNAVRHLHWRGDCQCWTSEETSRVDPVCIALGPFADIGEEVVDVT